MLFQLNNLNSMIILFLVYHELIEFYGVCHMEECFWTNQDGVYV